MNSSPPGSSVRGISQARILEWVAISFSRRSSQPRGWTHLSCIGRWILYHWANTGAHETTITLPWTLFSSAVKSQWWTPQLKTPTLISLKPLICSYENSCVTSVLRQHFFFFFPLRMSLFHPSEMLTQGCWCWQCCYNILAPPIFFSFLDFH